MNKNNKNSGFSLIELIIAMAVLAFLMVAVSSFMGSSVAHSKKAKIDVRLQTQAQETYSLITDTIMQASDVIIGGYTASSVDMLDFSQPGKEISDTLTKTYYVKDETVVAAIKDNPDVYALPDNPNSVSWKYFKDMDPDENVYVFYLRVESSVPIDMNLVPGADAGSTDTQSLTNYLKKGTPSEDVECTVVDGKNVYSENDTLVSTFYFDEGQLYYGRAYAFMTNLDDKVDMTDNDSKFDHLYNKYFSYVMAKDGTKDVPVPGCVASVDAENNTIGVNLYYNKANMDFVTEGRINTRNSYVLIPKK